jgi:multidrug resistance protein, MATE family
VRLTNDSTSSILRFLLPLLGNALVIYSFAIIDSVMMAGFGEATFAGVGLGSLFFGFVCAFFLGTLALYTPLSIRNSAASNDDGKSSRSILGVRTRYFWSTAAVGLVFAVAAWFLTSQVGLFLRLWKQPTQVITVAENFMNVLRWAVIPMMLSSSINQTANLCGRPAVNLYSALLGVSCNLFLNWVFIYGNLGAPALGASGCALSTVIARFAMVAFSYTWLNTRVPTATRVLTWLPRGLDRAFIGELLRRGIPRGLNNVSDWLLTFSLVLLIGRSGVVSGAANNVGDVFSSTIYLLPNAFCQVMTIVVARKIASAASPATIWKTILRLHAVLFAMEAIVVVGCLIAMPAIMRGFALTSTAPTWQLTRDILLMHLVFYVSYTTQHTFVAVLDAFLDTKIPSLAMFLVSAFFIFPAALLCSSQPPAIIWATEGVGVSFLSIFYFIRIRRNTFRIRVDDSQIQQTGLEQNKIPRHSIGRDLRGAPGIASTTPAAP